MQRVAAPDLNAKAMLLRLRDGVAATDANFTMAVAFHEVWKPAVNDGELHARMSNSYAGQAFLIVRTSLRRETLLALMRVWDETKGTGSLKHIFGDLAKTPIWQSLLTERLAKLQTRGLGEEARKLMTESKAELSRLHTSYRHGGERNAIYKKLKDLRDQNLAHTQAKPAAPISIDPFDAEVDHFYSDTATIVSGLMSLVNGEAHNYVDTGKVYSHYAGLFWEGARSESTEGHPRFRRRRSAA